MLFMLSLHYKLFLLCPLAGTGSLGGVRAPGSDQDYLVVS